MEKLIQEIYALKKEIEDQTKHLEEIKTLLAEKEKTLDDLNNQLLSAMQKQGVKELSVDNLVASYFCKDEFSYGDEKQLLAYLKEHSLNNYIKVVTKTTESIDKTVLKKDLKNDEKLKESLKDFVGDRKVEYVVVTTVENHQKMLEHIETGKNNKR